MIDDRLRETGSERLNTQGENAAQSQRENQ